MNKRLKEIFFRLVESYGIVSVLAILAGFLWPSTFLIFDRWSTLILQIIFFLSSLKIDFTQVRAAFKDHRALEVIVLFMLLGLPLITYVITRAIAPSLTAPFVLLAAMPTAMSVPLFVEIVGGNVSYSLVVTTVTSLLAPFTVPLVIKLLLGTTIYIDVTGMMVKLLIVIVLPFILAQIYRKTLHKKIPLADFRLKGLSIVLLGLLIAGIIAKNVREVNQLTFGLLAYYVIAVIIFYIALHWIGYYVTWWKDGKDRMTTAITTTYMNFVLSLYIASKYLGNDLHIVLPIIISIIPWTILVVPYSVLLKKLHKI